MRENARVVTSGGRLELWLHLLAVLGCSDEPAEGVGFKELIFSTHSVLICLCLKTFGDYFIWLLVVANDKAEAQPQFRVFDWTPLPGVGMVPYLFSFHFPGGGNWERRGLLEGKRFVEVLGENLDSRRHRSPGDFALRQPQRAEASAAPPALSLCLVLHRISYFTSVHSYDPLIPQICVLSSLLPGRECKSPQNPS